MVCVTTSSLSSLVVDGFDALLRSRAMCGLCYHVIAIVACHSRVQHPAALARDVWSVLARHRYRRLSLTGSTCCRARCVVFVRMSSLSSHVIVGFPALSLLLLLWGMSTPWVVSARARCGRFCGRVMLLLYCGKAVLCSYVRAVMALPSSGIRNYCYCTERRSPSLVRECAPAGLTLFVL